MDVVSLYTCIDHDFGLRACEHFLKTRSVCFYEHIKMLLEMVKYCLKENFFMFDGECYRQSIDTAMGTCLSPNFACLLMGWWEEQVARADEYEDFTRHVLIWIRYIDNLFILWDGPMEKAQRYVHLLNSNPFDLRFTTNMSQDSIEFLDI